MNETNPNPEPTSQEESPLVSNRRTFLAALGCSIASGAVASSAAAFPGVPSDLLSPEKPAAPAAPTTTGTCPFHAEAAAPQSVAGRGMRT